MNPHQLESEYDRLLSEFIQATNGILEPDPELGALILAAYELDNQLPPLRLYRSAA